MLSSFEFNQEFNEKNFAVTLVTVPSFTRQHAQIVVEGCKNGEPFRQYAHLAQLELDYGMVKGFRDLPLDKYTVYSSKTWVIPAEKAMHMMDTINQKNEDIVPFSLFGDSSILNQNELKENCCTWAITQLQAAGIDPWEGQANLGKNLLTMTSQITQPSTPLVQMFGGLNVAASAIYSFFSTKSQQTENLGGLGDKQVIDETLPGGP